MLVTDTNGVEATVKNNVEVVILSFEVNLEADFGSDDEKKRDKLRQSKKQKVVDRSGSVASKPPGDFGRTRHFETVRSGNILSRVVRL